MKKAVIFDVDGVIFDSERATLDCWRSVGRLYGFTVPDELYIRCIGVNNDVTREIFLDYYGEDFPYDDMEAEMMNKYAEKFGDGRMILKPGLLVCLESLRDAGFTLGLASSTRVRVIRRELDYAGITDNFDVILGGDDIEKSKPDPQIFLEAAKRLGVKPEETYVIEDSYNGIRAASAGGFIPIMVPDLVEPDEEMREKTAFIATTLMKAAKYILAR